MIGTLIAGFKLVKGFVGAYKWVMAGIAVAGILTSVFVYIDNHGEMKATIKSQDDDISQCFSDNEGLNATIEARNATIAGQNLAMRQMIEANKEKIAEANRAVVDLRLERAVLTEELGVARFETIEAIRDDEDFADWVDWDVPLAGWSLLRTSEEGEYPATGTDMP